MTPYETIAIVTTTADNQVVAIPCPPRCFITKISIYLEAADNSVGVAFYNRSGQGSTVKVVSVEPLADSNFIITTDGQHQSYPLDTIDYHSQGGDFSPSALAILSPFKLQFVNDEIPFAVGDTLRVNTAPKGISKVCPDLALEGAGGVYAVDNVGPFVNMDPITESSGGNNQKMYLHVSAASTFLVAIRASDTASRA